jgi:hypothetical protein
MTMWSSSAVRDAVRRALDGAADRTALADVEVCDVGSASLVLLTPWTAVRVGRDAARGAELERTQRLVDGFPDPPFHVPRSTGPVVRTEQVTAVPTRRITGDPHPPGNGDPGPLRDLLDAVHALDPGCDSPALAVRHAFTGGADWESVLRDQVVPLLPTVVRPEAGRRVDAVVSLPPVALRFGHGDLAGANVLWEDGKVSGVLDWDLATHEDPDEDLASLAWWHGWQLIDDIAPARELGRAEAYRDLFPLQLIAFQVLNAREDEQVARMVERVATLLTEQVQS